MKEPMALKFDLERVDYWISQGAQPSETAKRLIERFRAEQASA
jgi:ribosomal protein S16